jgi:hypothetical protein
MRVLRAFAEEIGKGLLAGFAGTLAMTASSTIEMKLRRRPPSSTPADAVGKVLGIQPRDDEGKRRLGYAAHFGYGTIWGLARAAAGAMLAAAGSRRSPLPLVAHFVAIWGTELAVLPRLGLIPPVKEWGGKELAIDGFHHLVYATATDLAYRAMDRG